MQGKEFGHYAAFYLMGLGAMASDLSMNLHSSLLLQKLYFQTPAILFMIDGGGGFRI